MNWKTLGISAGAVFGILSVVGLIISLLSTQLQCSKIGFMPSLKHGMIFAAVPTGIYAAAAAFDQVRNPFSSTLNSFGIPEDTSKIVGVGYLIMLGAWVTAVSAVNNTEKEVCVSTASEMTEFKKKLMAELAEKQQKEEANAHPTSPPTQ